LRFSQIASPSITTLLRCICDTKSCVERTRITFDHGMQNMIHIRVDGCVVKGNMSKRCDCLIIHTSDQKDSTFVFLVETKGASYHVNHVKKQLQKGRDEFNQCIQALSTHTLNVLEIRKMLPAPYKNDKTIAKAVVKAFSNIRQAKYQLVPVLYGKKNRIARLRRKPAVRIKAGGKKTEKIRYLYYNEDITKTVSLV
jgi:CDP-glycerol glycerophosphotransferase (TagB/SpsB family)